MPKDINWTEDIQKLTHYYKQNLTLPTVSDPCSVRWRCVSVTAARWAAVLRAASVLLPIFLWASVTIEEISDSHPWRNRMVMELKPTLFLRKIKSNQKPFRMQVKISDFCVLNGVSYLAWCNLWWKYFFVYGYEVKVILIVIKIISYNWEKHYMAKSTWATDHYTNIWFFSKMFPQISIEIDQILFV